MSCAFHNTTKRIVPLKNSGDIIERSTIGSIKAFVDESERESALVLCVGEFGSRGFSPLRPEPDCDRIQIWCSFQFDSECRFGDSCCLAMKKSLECFVTDCGVAAEQRSYRFHPARGLKRLDPRRHRPHISGLNVILIMMKLKCDSWCDFVMLYETHYRSDCVWLVICFVWSLLIIVLRYCGTQLHQQC